jgi:hypothetical protein
MTDEQRELAENVFKIVGPILPHLIYKHLKPLDPSIVGGFLVVFRENGTVAAMTGDADPVLTISVLRKAIDSLTEDTQFIQTGMADDSGKPN